jgi:hypothetical protein
MKNLFFILTMGLVLLGSANCQNKKNTTQKDNVTQLLLAAGGSGSNGSSCVKSTVCQEVLGNPPIGWSFADYCATQKGEVASQSCRDGGFTKCEEAPQNFAVIVTCQKG